MAGVLAAAILCGACRVCSASLDEQLKPPDYQAYNGSPVQTPDQQLKPPDYRAYMGSPVQTPDQQLKPPDYRAYRVSPVQTPDQYLKPPDYRAYMSSPVHTPDQQLKPPDYRAYRVSPVKTPDQHLKPPDYRAYIGSPVQTPEQQLKPPDYRAYVDSPVQTPDQQLKPPDYRAYRVSPVQTPDPRGTSSGKRVARHADGVTNTDRGGANMNISAMTANTHPLTSNTLSATADTPSVTVDTPSVTPDTPSVTNDTPSVTINATSATADMSSVTAHTPPATANTPTVTAHTPSVTPDTPSVTADTPLVTADKPSVTPDTPSVTPDTPSVTADTPSVTPDTPLVTADTPSVTADTPPMTPNTPSVTADTPSLTTNARPLTADTPSVTRDTPSGTADTPSVTTNARPVTANTPAVTVDKSLEASGHPRGLRTHVEGDRIVFVVNADYLADCVEGEGLKNRSLTENTVYLKNASTSTLKKGTLKIDFRSDIPTQASKSIEEQLKRCVIAIQSDYMVWIAVPYFDVSPGVSPKQHFQVRLYTNELDDTARVLSFDTGLERPQRTQFQRVPYVEVEWLSLPEALSMEVQFTAVDPQWKSRSGMTSPRTGFIKSPLWDGFSATALYFGAWRDTLSVTAPPGHGVMISWEQMGLGDWTDCSFLFVVLTERPYSYIAGDLYRYCGAATPSPVLLLWGWMFRVWVQVMSLYADSKFSSTAVTGYSMRYSFHNASALPQQLLPDKTWNCSVAHWPDFKQHLLCNLVTECAGGEDEADCPYTNGVCGPGNLAAGGSCFTFDPTPEALRYTSYTKPEALMSWAEAQAACRRRDARLPSLNTPAKWRAFVDLMSHRGWENIYIGLSSGDPSLPHMYNNFLQWSDSSVAYYIKADFLLDSQCSSCAFLKQTRRPDFLYMDSCSKKVPGNLVCEVDAGKSLEVHAAIDLDRGENKPYPRINTTRCPKGHVTYNFLSCDPMSDCKTHCYTSFSTYLTSLPPAFKCHKGFERVPFTLVCDHREDCSDGSDEICAFPPCQEFECNNRQCIGANRTCDGVMDCPDGSDERVCGGALGFIHTLNFSTPVPAKVLHDGKGFYDVYDMADSPALSTSSDTRSAAAKGCPSSHFQCPGVSYYCLPVYVICNGVKDCPGHQDEADCNNFQCPGFYRCRRSQVCLHRDHLCDGVFQCPQRDDELMCGFVCPVGCTCYGLAFFCTVPFDVSSHVGLRFLDASGSGMSLHSLSNNVMLFYLSLAKCNVTELETMHFVNVFHLDLSENLITTLTEKHISQCQNLQNLVLAHNPLRTILEDSSSSGGATFALLHTLDLSAVSIPAAQMANLRVFPNVSHLNLSNAGLDTLSEFSFFRKLRVLDLRGCPATYFTRSVFQGLDDLTVVYADSYKLCCPETLPDGFNVRNCHAPFDEVSSCEGLLKSGLYRVSLSVLTAMILMGNAGSFAYRVFINRPEQQSSFSLFVTNLCVSDFLMGLYSAIIGVTDRLYLGNYVWNDVTWRRSVTCKMAGMLSLASNEVSVLIICLITVDRFLVTRFPFSRHLHFSLRSARVACVTAWSVGVLLATLPLLPATSHWQVYSQTGICIPLPVIREWFAGRQYSFGILIILNFVLFLVIASGQVFIYLSIRANSMPTSETTQKAKDLTLARRFVTVAVSDFLCWFPVGLLGIFSSRGHPILDEANIVVAVFVLPFNSALNPFLYAINVILERRQKAREQRLLQIIMSRQSAAIAQREGKQSK